MAREPFPIDDPDDEIPPASPARRRGAMITGCLFIVVVVVFLVWFTAENSDPPEDQPSLFGWIAPPSPVTIL